MTSLDNLFGNAVADGALSQGALGAINIADVGAAINQALGVSVDDVVASEVTLVTLIIDDSGSIRFSGNASAVRSGHNTVVNALAKSKQKDGIIIMCRYINGAVLYPYVTIDQAVTMDEHNYNPNQGTPLYDATVEGLATVLAKTQEFTDAGIACRSVSLIMTDGADLHSKRSAKDVQKVVSDMLRSENHIVAFMGVDDGQTDFRAVAESMGIPNDWVLTPGNNESEIRKAFQVFSQSAVRVSQTAGNINNVAVGGFGN